jgi:Flp pilus assembly pilin Flp
MTTIAKLRNQQPEVDPVAREEYMVQFCRHIWSDEKGQDIAEYAVMLAVILVLVIGTVRLIGGNANNAFSTVASSLSQ